MQPSVQVRISGAVGAALLSAAALLIWVVSEVDFNNAPLSLPIAIGPLLFYLLGRPWRLRRSPRAIPASVMLLASLGFLCGLMIEFVLLATIAWIALVHSWLNAYFSDCQRRPRWRLETLLLFSFPWIVHDGQWISDVFQWSGAVAAEFGAQCLRFDVVRNGQNLLVGETQLSIGPSCSGIQTLQITMLCGSALAVMRLGRSTRFWHAIPILIVIAWGINCLRIIGLVCLAEFGSSPEMVAELHDTTGYLAVLLVVPLVLIALGLLDRNARPVNGRPLWHPGLSDESLHSPAGQASR